MNALSHGKGIALPLALMLCVLVRLCFVDRLLWFDEYASLYFARQPLQHLWGDWMLRETNPPLFYSLLRGWSLLVPSSPAALRVLPIAIGTGSVALIYVGMRAVFGAPAGLVAALIGAVAPLHVLYSLELRGYILEFAGVSASLFALMIVGDENRRRVHPFAWAGYVLGCLIAIYSHTTALLWPPIASVALAASDPSHWRTREQLRRLIGANLAVALGAAWWLTITLQQGVYHQNLQWLQDRGVSGNLRLVRQSVFLLDAPSKLRNFLLLPILMLIALALHRARRDRNARFLCIVFALSVLTFMGMSFVRPIAVERTLFWMNIFSICLVAIGLTSLPTGRVRTAAAMVLGAALVSGLLVARTRGMEEWSADLKVIAAQPNAGVVTFGDAQSLVLSEACEMYLRRPTCPFPVFVLPQDPPGLDQWAVGAGRPRPTPGPIIVSQRVSLHVFRHMEGLRRIDARQVPGIRVVP